jgi:hypothetical protein
LTSSNHAWICGVWAAGEGHLALLHGRCCIQRGSFSPVTPMHAVAVDSTQSRGGGQRTSEGHFLASLFASVLMGFGTQTTGQRQHLLSLTISQFALSIILNLTRRFSRASHGNIAKMASEVRLHVHRLQSSKRQY